jgi:hypothetical protein
MRSICRVGAALLVLVALAGCHRKGENLPLEEARFRVIRPVVPERVLITPPRPEIFPETVVRVAGGLWQAGFREYRLTAREVQPVGRAGGLTFYALAWDREPFDRLLVAEPGRPGEYREFLEVY